MTQGVSRKEKITWSPPQLQLTKQKHIRFHKTIIKKRQGVSRHVLLCLIDYTMWRDYSVARESGKSFSAKCIVDPNNQGSLKEEKMGDQIITNSASFSELNWANLGEKRLSISSSIKWGQGLTVLFHRALLE